LLDMGRLRQLFEARIPARHRRAGSRLLDEIADVMRGYIRGRFLIALITAILYAAGLLIFRVPLWAAIGAIAGLLGIIPYLGVLAGVVLALGFAALDGASLVRLGGVVGVFIVAQLIEDYLLMPRIVGNRLALHPMVVFIGLIVMGNLFGLLGILLAIPMLGIARVVLRFLDEWYLNSDFYLAPAERIAPSPIVEERHDSG
ncbi:MAG TPA: AI-2E family transporter, partial [Methylomirabilota bacterium]|nr:AI-2E family transporter [Methylomirabilota bacterium]